MLKLENVSTKGLLSYYKRRGSEDELYHYIYELLISYGITDYQKLKELVFSNNKELANSGIIVELLSELKNVELLVKNYSMFFNKADVYEFNNYSHSDLDDKTILVTDEKNKGDILLLNNVFVRGGAIRNGLNDLSIAEIKYLLEHVDSIRLVNLLSGKRNFGPVINKRVYDSICFYEEQVLRCADETTERGIDLFKIDREEKRKIVDEELKDIVSYIVDTADTLVWGELSDTNKKRMITAALSTRGYWTQHDRTRLIDTFSNYTTLSELKEGVVKKKTLDRFITKKK